MLVWTVRPVVGHTWPHVSEKSNIWKVMLNTGELRLLRPSDWATHFRASEPCSQPSYKCFRVKRMVLVMLPAASRASPWHGGCSRKISLLLSLLQLRAPRLHLEKQFHTALTHMGCCRNQESVHIMAHAIDLDLCRGTAVPRSIPWHCRAAVPAVPGALAAW